jgi:hypothetical protein
MPGVASPCLLRFQGLITLLAAFSSQPSETLIEPQAFLGFSPSEVYSPQRAQPLSRPFTLLPFSSGCMALHLSEPGLQSLFPLRLRFLGSLTKSQSRSSLGVLSLGSLSPATLSTPFGAPPLLYFSVSPPFQEDRQRYSRVSLSQEQSVDDASDLPLWPFRLIDLSKPFGTMVGCGLIFFAEPPVMHYYIT